jgi:hypothetical protein
MVDVIVSAARRVGRRLRTTWDSCRRFMFGRDIARARRPAPVFDAQWRVTVSPPFGEARHACVETDVTRKARLRTGRLMYAHAGAKMTVQRSRFGILRTRAGARGRDGWAAGYAVSAVTLLALGACGDTGHDLYFELPHATEKAPTTAEKACSSVTLVVVTPLQTGIGGTGDLHAQSDTQSMSFSWTGSRGVRVSNSRWADASFTCIASGSQTLTLRATDPNHCVERYDVDINCVGS